MWGEEKREGRIGGEARVVEREMEGGRRGKEEREEEEEEKEGGGE